MVSTEQAISLIREQVFDEMLPRYTFGSMKDKTFQKESYLLWAADELMGMLLLRRTETPIRVIRDYKAKMSSFARLNKKSKLPFETAYDLAENIIDIFRAAGWAEE